MFENARIALDIMSLDIQTIHYENRKIPFWHKPMTDPDNATESYIAPPGPNEPPYSRFANEMLAFVSVTPTPHTTDVSTQYEIKYQLAFAKTNEFDAGWLMRSATGDSAAAKAIFRREDGWDDTKLTVAGWAAMAFPNNWPNNSSIWPVVGCEKNDWEFVYTQGEGSSEPYRRLIPHVTELEFICMDKNFNILSDKWYLGAPGMPARVPAINYDYRASSSPFPYMIMIKLSLMDTVAWEKWLIMGGLPHEPMRGGEASAPAKKFREQNQRTFNKLVLIGDRGQYE
jgi:hypothetical protein